MFIGRDPAYCVVKTERIIESTNLKLFQLHFHREGSA